MADSNELRITIDDKTVDSAKAAVQSESSDTQAARKAGSSAREIVNELRRSAQNAPPADSPGLTGAEAATTAPRKRYDAVAEIERELEELRKGIERHAENLEELHEMRRARANRTESALGSVQIGNRTIRPDSHQNAHREAEASRRQEMIAENYTGSVMDFMRRADSVARATRPSLLTASLSSIVKRRTHAKRPPADSSLIKKRRVHDLLNSSGKSRKPKGIDVDFRSIASGFARSVVDAVKSAPSAAGSGYRSAMSAIKKAPATYSRIGRFAYDNLAKGNLQRATVRAVGSSFNRSRAAFRASMGASRAAGVGGVAATGRAVGASVSTFMTSAAGAASAFALAAMAAVGAMYLLYAGVKFLVSKIDEMRERLRDFMPKTAVAEARGDFRMQVSRLRTGLREDEGMANFRESQMQISLAFEKISDAFTGVAMTFLSPLAAGLASILDVLADLAVTIRNLFTAIMDIPKNGVSLLYDAAVEPILARLVAIYNKIPGVEDVDVKKMLADIRAKIIGEPAAVRPGAGAEMDPWIESLLFGVPIPK
jgi:hypothetical protein